MTALPQIVLVRSIEADSIDSEDQISVLSILSIKPSLQTLSSRHLPAIRLDTINDWYVPFFAVGTILSRVSFGSVIAAEFLILNVCFLVSDVWTPPTYLRKLVSTKTKESIQ